MMLDDSAAPILDPPADRSPVSLWRVHAHPDLAALLVLVGLTLLAVWNRVVFDSWLTRYDLFTQIIPWYGHLGERLRGGDIPGWNPHQLSGTPFAGHPLSGWMYFPAMAVFPFVPVLTGFKVFMAAHVLLASLSTYAYARVLGLYRTPALVASVAFALGPLLEWTTYTSLQFAQFAAWVPLALLGIELAFRQHTWRGRLLPASVAALAFSQMLAGWVGEGWLYAVLLLGAYVLARGLSDRPSGWAAYAQRGWLVAGISLLVLAGGAALGAAGLLPRLAVNAQTNLAGGDYSALGAGGVLNPPWTAEHLATQVVGAGDGYHFRAAGYGGAVVALALFALMLTPRRFPAPFFAILTGVALVLTLPTTPLHQLFYLIPRYQHLHEHDPWRVIAVVSVGPAILSGMAVQALLERVRPPAFALLLLATGGLLGGIVLTRAPAEGVARWAPSLAIFAVTLLAAVILGQTLRPRGAESIPRSAHALAALLIVVVFVQPTGLEVSGSWFGWPVDARWTERWEQDPATAQALDAEVMPSDGDGAGAFLQAQLATKGPFRYLGYGGVGHPDGGWQAQTYMDRRFDPDVQAILVNGRPLMLGLHEVQGYDPIQLSAYVAVIRAINGKGQDYHTAFVSDEGVQSPLLDLLNVRYVLVPHSLPHDRPDVVRLLENTTAVYEGAQVTIYEREPNPVHAWIVHDVQRVDPGDGLASIADGSVDPRETALIEGSVPKVEEAEPSEGNRASVTIYEPDRIQVRTEATAPALLVVSEIYAEGWRATVNGVDVAITPVNHAFRGVAIPAGNATVEMRYEPLALRVGTWISGLAALGFALVVLDALRQQGVRRMGPAGAQQTSRAQHPESSDL